MDPLTLALLAGGGSAMGQVGQFIAGGPQREQQRLETRLLGEQGERRQSIFDFLMPQLRSGNVIGQGARNRFQSGFQESLAPFMGRQQALLGRGSSVFSPEVQRSLSQTAGRQAGQFSLGLEQQNQQQLSQLRRILGGI